MKEKIEKMLAELEVRLKIANNELKACPEGTLSVVKREGKMTFFQIMYLEGRRQRKSLAKTPELIFGLARKEYLTKEKDILEKDVKVLKAAIKSLVEPSADNVLSSISGHLRDVPDKYFFLENLKNSGSSSGGNSGKNTDRKINWADRPYRMSSYRAEEKTHTTSRGLKVRSKSEVLIAEMLYRYNIPFRYEQVIQIGDIILVPDFTIRLPDGRIVYWEHCGLMVLKEYREHHKRKMEAYEKAGIVPWKNLILTYDDENGNINVGIIESEIKNKLR